MTILTKKYRLVWDDDKIRLYGEYDLNTQTVSNHNVYECDTLDELNAKVLSLGFEIPEEELIEPEVVE